MKPTTITFIWIGLLSVNFLTCNILELALNDHEKYVNILTMWRHYIFWFGLAIIILSAIRKLSISIAKKKAEKKEKKRNKSRLL